jgi:uncharacterized protein YdhG (YjbR/CyaY superfamily)
MKTKSGVKIKTCSRGHKYAGSEPCPVCWPAGAVRAYFARAPKEARSKLNEMRKIIKSIAPKSSESISYGMPGYDKGRIAWFASMKGYVGLYLRPPIIGEHTKELAKYKTTKSAIHFPLSEKLPAPLIKKLIRARIKRNGVKR